MTTRHAFAVTSIGDIQFVADGDAIIGVYFPGHWYPPKDSAIGELVDAASDPLISDAAAQLREYLAGARAAFDVSVRTAGDEFSEKVWQILAQIPYGQTTTYGAIAERLGDKRLAQRVGQCVGRNPISILIPCHRVVGADGSLTGFAGGLERKRTLLELEEPAEVSATRLF